MKILHLCLAAFYIDNYGYQENLITKFHKLQGHDVKIIASTESYGASKERVYLKPSEYINENGIPVVRLPYSSIIPGKFRSKVRSYEGVLDQLNKFQPDVIFIHGVQFWDAYTVKKYLQRNKETVVFADNHSDYGNSAKTFFSKFVLHKIFYRYCAKLLEKHVLRFYGTTPVRSQFLAEVYGINEKKISTLPTGYDDSITKIEERDSIRNTFRDRLNLRNSDFLIITGGKIDERKKIHNLVEALRILNRNDIKLILIGMPDEAMTSFYEELDNLDFVVKLGWLTQEELQESVVAADLAIFPGTHSVLWEQVAGLGVPGFFRRWEGFQHLDIGGNCIFLENGSEEEIVSTLTTLLDEKEETYNQMLKIARSKGPKNFSYSEISKRAIKF